MKQMLPSGSEKYAAEFIGTYMLVFTIGCNVLTGSRIWLPVSIACALTVAVYIFGSVSGANFNPAVSIALGLTKQKAWKEVCIYCGVQVLAGILAAFTYGLVLWEVFTLKPASGYGWWEACLAEMLYTCMLCFVVLHVSADVPAYFDADGAKPNGAAGNQYFGLAIGFVLVAAIPAGGHISGGCFNPAVAIGIDLSSALMGLFWFIPYTIAELLGATLAAMLFHMTNPCIHNIRGEPTGRTKYIAEFIGTFFLVLTVGLNVIGKSNAPVFSIAASLMCMIFALGRVSGGHFNPAVTLCVLAAGRNKIEPRDALSYMAMQLLGGLTGGIVYAIMEQGRSFPLAIGKGFGWGHAMAGEALFTFLLCYVVLAAATTKTAKSQFFGLAIGSCVTAGGIAIGVISGGVLNPAVAFAVALTSSLGGGTFWTCIPYFLFQILGGGFAAGIFRLTRPSEYGK